MGKLDTADVSIINVLVGTRNSYYTVRTSIFTEKI